MRRIVQTIAAPPPYTDDTLLLAQQRLGAGIGRIEVQLGRNTADDV